MTAAAGRQQNIARPTASNMAAEPASGAKAGHGSHRRPFTRAMTARIVSFCASAAMSVVTLPYYRFYRQNTLLPIQRLAKALRKRENPLDVSRKLQLWRERKLSEAQFVQVSGTLLAAAVIGCFSWPLDNDIRAFPHWLGPGAWYSSLVLSLCAVLLSSSQSFIFSTLKSSPRSPDLARELGMVLRLARPYWDEASFTAAHWASSPSPLPLASDHFGPDGGGGDDGQPSSSRRPTMAVKIRLDVADGPVEVDIRWNMVFAWQAPMMLMAYSVVAFLIGLAIHVTRPLYDGREFSGDSKAPIMFLVLSAVSLFVFVWCSFWVYKFVDLDPSFPPSEE
ncbi:hypothetical protein RB595_000482 [Gaeumannomyces hyphopodioides]